MTHQAFTKHDLVWSWLADCEAISPFARGPKGVRLQGEVMKTVSRVAKVFSRGRNHMKHLAEANLQSRTF